MTITAMRPSAAKAAGDMVPAPVGGPLPGTRLVGYREVAGGWAAWIVDDLGVYNADRYLAAVPQIATKYRMSRSMITVLPDPEDETRAEIFAQRHPPIRDLVPWGGPESVDGPAGRALFAIYADGTPLHFPIYRRGWGVYHCAFFGSTGSGKSAAACQALAIDRWAHNIDPVTGKPRGMVASFLIDPKRGQSFAPFRGELAAPAAETVEEATVMWDALTREAWRRNGYLAHEVTWDDPKRKRDGKPVKRTGRDWWDPMVDGPNFSVTLDEAHLPLADRKFAEKVTAGSRLFRSVGIQIRLISQVSLLTDLGGSTALRDMLTGGFVWIGRSNNGLSGQLALNGRMNIDPRVIPAGLDGAAVILTPDDPKGMLARTGWMPDWYDALRDENDDPIGYPAEIPEETWDAFGDEFRGFCRQKRDNPLQPWTPQRPVIAVVGKAPDPKCRDVVYGILADARRAAETGQGPAALDMNAIVKRQRDLGHDYSTDTIRKALKTFTDPQPGDDGPCPVVVLSGRESREWMLTDDAYAATLEQGEQEAA